MTKPVSWHVLGAGAMGCLWAARLVQQGHDCRLVLKDEHSLGQLQQSAGLQLLFGKDTFHFPVTGSTPALLTEPIANLLVATKAGDVIPALASVQHRITSRTRVVLLQNGLKIQQLLRSQDQHDQYFCLSTSHGAWLQASFHVVHAGFGKAWLGQLPRPGDSAEQSASRSATLMQLLPSEQMNISVDNQMQQRLWQKLAVNCAINPLTVIFNCPNGRLLEPDFQQTLQQICGEIEIIMIACSGFKPDRSVLSLTIEVLEATAQNLSSSLQDARRGRPLELQHLNGHLCELADEAGIGCQFNRALLECAERAVRETYPAPA